jgi:hypothetical protein
VVLRQSISLLPSPLKSPVAAINQLLGTAPRLPDCKTCKPFNSQTAHVTGYAVTPKEVALGVPVEVPGSNDSPIAGDRAETSAPYDLQAIHEPDGPRAGVRDPPNNVVIPIAIEVTGSGYRPIGRDYAKSTCLCDLHAVQEPDRHRAGAAVARATTAFGGATPG